MLSSLLLLKGLEDENRALSELVAEVPEYPTIRENIACRSEVKCKIVEDIGEKLQSVFPKYKEFSKVDGVRLTLNEGWILVRASGTEPLIRLTVGGESLKAAKQIMKESINQVKRIVEGNKL